MTEPLLGRRALGRALPARRHLLASTDLAPAAPVHHLGGRRADRRAAEAGVERVPAFAGAGDGGSVRFGEPG
ncbi:hypothetical protein ACGF13_10065 [Kitasatospora sp. NPDC048286]|uniref:hypothetical protein n=1 Tax=Kitasatospora sp. NPDC048286 TaxID=3364047 RepID=UPI00371304D1